MNYTLEEFNLSKFLYIRYIFLNSIVINTYLTPIHIFLLLVRSIWTKFKLINISLHIQNFICEANSFSLKLLLGIVFLVEVLWNRRRIVPRTIQLNVKTSQQKKYVCNGWYYYFNIMPETWHGVSCGCQALSSRF